ncbi:MAG: histidine phosphatase family protein [Solirubrobacterales bacterium]|nr:histidine phosphatase family protein [Solirubrobacterales bacterium]
MARQIWLLRHADAEPHGTRPDHERQLTSRGERQAAAAGMALAGMRVTFDAVLASPRVRARRTAELAVAEWSDHTRPPLQSYAPLDRGFDSSAALGAFAHVGARNRLLLVGHEPDLSNVIASLTGGAADLKKGGLAALALAGARAELILLLRPKELALMAARVRQPA